MRILGPPIFSVCLLLAGLGAHAAEFRSVVTPFLETNCLDCHEGADSKGNVNLDGSIATIDTPARAALWMKVIEQLQADLMPPAKKKRPDATARRAVIHWAETTLLASDYGDAYREKLLLPEYGNRVDHETLFSGEIKAKAFSRPRLWRLSPEIHAANSPRNTATPFVYSTKESELRDYSATSTVDQSTIETIIVSVNKMLDEQLLKVRGGVKRVISFNQGQNKEIRYQPQPRHRYFPFLQEAQPGEGQIRRLVIEEFQLVHRRTPDAKERDRYVAFLQQNLAAGGNIGGMRSTVLAIYLGPEAIFRMELGLGEHGEHGRRRLSAKEAAYAIGYALRDKNPLRDKLITKALSEGRFKIRKGIAETVKEMLAEPDSIQGRGSALLSYVWSNPRVLRFFREFFGYHRAPQIFKDLARRKAEFGQVSPSTSLEKQAVRDLDNLIHLILEDDQEVLQTLLTTDRFLIGHPGDNEIVGQRHAEFMAKLTANTSGKGKKLPQRLANDARKALKRGVVPYESTTKQIAQAQLYNLPIGPNGEQAWDFAVEQPVQLPHRKGVLTHPAWLWAHSSNFDNDPIHRGIWIYTHLLAGVMPDVPPDVDARVPDDPHKTLRERLDLVRQAECWKCHRQINPLGETFEIFDDWGRYRDRFYFDQQKELVAARDNSFKRRSKAGQLTERPIVASGSLNGHEVNDAFELIDRLAKSERVRQSFVRHAFRYFLGRNETLNDSPTLIAADRAYVENGGSFKALVVSLLTSDSFLYRK